MSNENNTKDITATGQPYSKLAEKTVTLNILLILQTVSSALMLEQSEQEKHFYLITAMDVY